MVQGRIKKDLSQTLNIKDGDAKHCKKSKARERLTKKWKLFIYTVILLLSVFVFTGIIMYINLYPTNQCRKGYLNVHIIPYMPSTLDSFVSPEEYFTNDVQNALDLIVQELENDEQRRFTLTETYSLWKWWGDQSETTKISVRKLINDGRLEIAGGGWCIPDEATVHYTSFIDQFTWGLRCLKEIAGREVAPDVSFIVDNRGHSRELASLLKAMDFRAVILGGISPIEQCYRRVYRKMEFLWSNGEILGFGNEKPNIFASILDDKALRASTFFSQGRTVRNLDELLSIVKCQAVGYNTNNIYIPVGDFFPRNSSESSFSVIDSVINETRQMPKYKLNIFYSTPSNYINSVTHGDDRWLRTFGDFLPYSDGDFEYWTGYYSSRPTLKYFERKVNGFFQVFKQTLSMSNMGSEFSDDLIHLRENIGLSQHHKGAIGVTSPTTADYFSSMLGYSLNKAADAASKALNKISLRGSSGILNYESCLRLNMSECRVSEENEAFVLTVYNPSNRLVNQYVRIPVTRDNYLVRTGDGESLTTQIVDIPQRILSMPGRKSSATKELIFRASKVPAMGLKSYYITAVDAPRNKTEFSRKTMKIIFDELTGRITAVKRENGTYPISQDLRFYSTWLSRNSIFKPESRPDTISDGSHIELLNDGELVSEYQQTVGPWASQIISIYKDEDFIEFKWIVGPIPFRFFEGKEVITLYRTNIKSSETFYVDANGREFERRRRSAELETETVGTYIARNYRPVNSHIAIADSSSQLHIFNDRVQGGASIFDGELELMVHRRLFNFVNGVYDLYERGDKAELIVSGQHWVFIGSSEDSKLNKSIENFAAASHWEPWYFLANASDLPYEAWKDNHEAEFSGLKKTLPKNLRIISLEPWENGTLLLRLENTGKDGCDKVQANLQDLFSVFTVTSATEVTLGGNGFKNAKGSYTEFIPNPIVSRADGNKLTNFNIFVHPSQIKTFLINIKPLY